MTGTPANEFFNNIEGQENMGRGERSKKKRRFRSLSPVGRGTPGAGGGSGYGGQDGGLQEGYVFWLLSCLGADVLTRTLQGETDMAMLTLLGLGDCRLGCPRRTQRTAYPVQQLRVPLRT